MQSNSLGSIQTHSDGALSRAENILNILENNPDNFAYTIESAQRAIDEAARQCYPENNEEISVLRARLAAITPRIALRNAEKQITFLENNPDNFVYTVESAQRAIDEAARQCYPENNEEISVLRARLAAITPRIALRNAEKQITFLENNPDNFVYTIESAQRAIDQAARHPENPIAILVSLNSRLKTLKTLKNKD